MKTNNALYILGFNRELQKILSSRKAKPFIFAGAGVSMDSDLPSWSNFIQSCVKTSFSNTMTVDQLAKIHGESEDSIWLIEYSLQNFLSKKNGEDEIDFFHSCLWGDKKVIEPSVTHYLIVQYAFKFNVPIVTTNYDDLFEEACKKLNLKPKIYSSRSSIPSSIGFSIIYIHGRIPRDKSEMKKNKKGQKPVTGFYSYYEEFNNNNNKALTYFKKLLNEKHCLFVGTSMKDHNVNRILYQNSKTKKSHYHFWFSQNKNSNLFQRNHHENFWKSQKVRPIYCESGSFTEITSTFRRILNLKQFNKPSKYDHAKLYKNLNAVYNEFKDEDLFHKIVGPFDQCNMDIYLDESVSTESIKMKKIWSSEFLDIKKFDSDKRKREFYIPLNFMSSEFDDFVSEVPFAVKKATDDAKVYVCLKEENHDYLDGRGIGGFQSWGFICFPIYASNLDRPISIVVIKFFNKNNILKDVIFERNSPLRQTYFRDIVGLGVVVNAYYKLVFGV